MRKIVAATILIVITLSLVACGGGEAAAPDTTAGGGTAAAPPAVPGGESASTLTSDTLSPPEVVTNAPFPKTKTTPSDVATRLQNRQAMMLLFYDPSQTETGEQRALLDAVAEKYRGLIDLLVFDVSEGLSGSSGEKDKDVQAVVDMAAELKVTYTPYIVFVDRAGRVTARFSGYTDQETLEREALRATQ